MQVFEIELDISAQKAWELVGEKFGETGQWTSELDSSYMVGETGEGGHRVCKQGKKTFTEHLLKYDPDIMALEYELIEGRPAIIASAGNQWVIQPLGANRCKLVMSPVFKPHWWAFFMAPLISLGLKGPINRVLEEFKHWAETGELHPRKVAKNGEA